MENGSFDWYTIVKDSDEITQGDIFINFPIIKVKNYEEVFKLDNVDNFTAEYGIEYSDFIVLTQPCEIANMKPDLKDIILCRIHEIDKYVEDTKCGKGKLCDIVDGKRPQFYMLNKCDEFSYKDDMYIMDKFDFHIVDFSIIERVPVEALKRYAQKIPSRLRLLPPYREHLAQSFAKYFMRIGLPSNIDKTVFSKYSKQ